MPKIIIYFRRAVYITFLVITGIFGIRPIKIVILCYHSIGSDWRFAVSRQEFTRQMEYLKKHYQIVPMSKLVELLIYKKNPANNLAVITFDDGYSDLLSIADYLKASRIFPTVFVCPVTNKINRHVLGTSKSLLTTKELLVLKRNGWEIGCHSATHSDMKTQSHDQLINEISKAKKSLETKLGIDINYFSYPKGSYTQQIIKMVSQSGYLAAVTMDDAEISRSSDIYTLPRIGVDGTHSFTEFRGLITSSAVYFRKILKQLPFIKSRIC